MLSLQKCRYIENQVPIDLGCGLNPNIPIININPWSGQIENEVEYEQVIGICGNCKNLDYCNKFENKNTCVNWGFCQRRFFFQSLKKKCINAEKNLCVDERLGVGIKKKFIPRYDTGICATCIIQNNIICK